MVLDCCRAVFVSFHLLHKRWNTSSNYASFPNFHPLWTRTRWSILNTWVIKSTLRVTLPIQLSFQDLMWWGCHKEHWMKGFTCSAARGWEAHQDTYPCCISGSGSLGLHKLFLHWRDEGYHMCGTAASAPHYMSGCIFPSHSKDSSYHELRHRTIGEVVNSDVHPKSTGRLSKKWKETHRAINRHLPKTGGLTGNWVYIPVTVQFHLSCINKAECQSIDAFELWCWRRLRWDPWTARSNQSILKEINPEYSLEGLLLKLQYSGHLMLRADSLVKTLMLRKSEGKRGGRE